MTDMVNHPPHYTEGRDPAHEPINVIEAWDLGFCLGNAVKYISRAGRKSESPLEDLRKSAWYLNREIERLEREITPPACQHPCKEKKFSEFSYWYVCTHCGETLP